MRVKAVDKLSEERNPHVLHEGLASVIANPSAGGGLPEGWIEEHLDVMHGTRLHLRVSDPMSVSLDGEAVEAQDLAFQCVPEAIHVVGADADRRVDASDQGGAP